MRNGCIACPAHEITNRDGDKCIECTNNGEIPNDMKNGCNACAVNQITNPDGDKCIDCPGQQVPNEDKTGCVEG